MLYVRSSPRERGTNRQVEGEMHNGQRLVVIEDTVTTGSSTILPSEVVRNAGGIVDRCVAILSYEAFFATRQFNERALSLVALTGLSSLLIVAETQGYLSALQANAVRKWAEWHSRVWPAADAWRPELRARCVMLVIPERDSKQPASGWFPSDTPASPAPLTPEHAAKQSSTIPIKQGSWRPSHLPRSPIAMEGYDSGQ